MSTDNSSITYWYHPESDGLFISPKEEIPVDPLCVELDEYEYVKRLIDQIDRDDAHKLPEGIIAVIKLAEIHDPKHISGMIWYDRYGRFVNGYPINLSPITSKEPGGIYVTGTNNKYLVEVILNG